MRLIRWICVLPGALLAALLISFPIHWLALRFDAKGLLPGISWQQFERLGYALILPYVMIIAGAYIAPRYKARASLVLAAIVGFLAICGIVIVASNDSLTLDGPLWQHILTVGFWFISFSYGIYSTRRADEW